LWTLRPGNVVYGAAWRPDDRQIITASDKGLQLWDAATGQSIGKPFGTSQDRVSRDAWNSSGTQVVTAAGDKGAQIWEVHSGRLLQPINQNTEPVTSAAWNPTDQTVATGSTEGTAGVWNAQNGGNLLLFSTGHQINSVSWSSSGRTLLAGGNDSYVHIYAIGVEQAVLSGGNAVVTATTFSPDRSQIVVGSSDGTIRIYFVEFTMIRQYAQSMVGNQRLTDSQIQAIIDNKLNLLTPTAIPE
jgi:WD40 repeat protein